MKVPCMNPIPLLGNMTLYTFRRVSLAENIDMVYRQFPDARYCGLYNLTKSIYMIRDPELINTITIKNFDCFTDHINFVNEDSEPLAARNLFGMQGDQWREMRKLMSPIFTTSKIKMMFDLICQCADNFSNFVATESEASGTTYNMKETCSRYSNDVVTSCAFGIHVDSFKNPNNEFFILGRDNLNFNSFSLKFYLNRTFPKLAKLLKLKVFNPKVGMFFKQLVTDSVKMRKDQGIINPDLIQLLMNIKGEDQECVLNIYEMTAQIFVFFFAGFDSSSTTMSFVVHEVGVNPDVQRKLREEIDRVVKLTSGKPTYEIINSMPYLDAVFKETLRLYPLLSFLDRVCVKEFELPPATPDGKPVKLMPGDIIWMPPYSIHRDPKYFSEPDKFDPDRFLYGNVNQSTYIPFGIGPRICIARRFVIMEVKIMLFYLLWRCELESAAKTTIPIVLNKKTFVNMSEYGFWLKMRARQSTVPVAP